MGRRDDARARRRAVAGLGDLIDDYEFHYPQELSEENLDDVRAALGGHGIYAVATGTHLNPRFGKGGLSSPRTTFATRRSRRRCGLPTSPRRSARR